MAASDEVRPLFIVDPRLAGKWSDATARMAFLAQSLRCLDDAIASHGGRLEILEGNPEEVIQKLITDSSINGVYTNRDYTPLAQRRDRALKSVCDAHGVSFNSYADQLLNEPESVSKADGLPYTIFTPYFRKARQHRILAPDNTTDFNFCKPEGRDLLASSSLALYLDFPLHETGIEAGRSGAEATLSNLTAFSDYENSKDIPAQAGTSRLSVHLKFGTCSVREVYQALKSAHTESHGMIRQLYWRDFYFQIGHFFPHVYHASFRTKYNALKWDTNEAGFIAWKAGKTGFPIVDAGMRELLATGFMHNRVRMIVASFLTKNLLINWQRGESHFADHLLDYDPALNNGNWQWGASTGCDAQPYFRVFNPWRQQLRFDKDCTYIKKWIPELRDLDPRDIHQLEKNEGGYLDRVVDLKESAAESKKRFKDLS